MYPIRLFIGNHHGRSSRQKNGALSPLKFTVTDPT
jgi:hypothetical protein